MLKPAVDRRKDGNVGCGADGAGETGCINRTTQRRKTCSSQSVGGVVWDGEEPIDNVDNASVVSNVLYQSAMFTVASSL